MNKKIIVFLIIGIFLLSFVTSAVYSLNDSVCNCPVFEPCPECIVCSTPIMINETSCATVINDLKKSFDWSKIIFLILGIILGLVISKKFLKKKFNSNKIISFKKEVEKEIKKPFIKDNQDFKQIKNASKKIGETKKELKDLINNQQPDVKGLARHNGGGERAGRDGFPLIPGYSDSGKAEEYPPVDIIKKEVKKEELNELIDELGLGKEVKEKFDMLDKEQNEKKQKISD